MANRHSDLKEWQEQLPNPPYRYVPNSATIVSNDGTTIASVGGDLKLGELAAAGELMAHCATRLPALIAAAEAFVMDAAGLSEEERDKLNCEIYNELHDQISMAKAEHLTDDGSRAAVPAMPDMSDVLKEGEEAKRLLREITHELQVHMGGHWTEQLDTLIQAAEKFNFAQAKPLTPEQQLSQLAWRVYHVAKDGEHGPSNRLDMIISLAQPYVLKG